WPCMLSPFFTAWWRSILTACSRWSSTGIPPVPIRWVLIRAPRDPRGTFRTQALLCTDLDAESLQILSWFVRRWQREVTFHEVRPPLAAETSAQRDGPRPPADHPCPALASPPWCPCKHPPRAPAPPPPSASPRGTPNPPRPSPTRSQWSVATG